MKNVHNSVKAKERCEICGVRFINVQAHKVVLKRKLMLIIKNK